MGHSRKQPFHGFCARSDKTFKKHEHRRERRAVRTKLASGIDDADRRMHSKVYGDPWNSPKDGKTWSPDWPRAYRK